MKISRQHRKRIVDLADKLFEAGINWIPMSPYRKPITYYQGKRLTFEDTFHKPITRERHEFFKEICLNSDNCAGIAVIPINGLILIDFDPAKNPKYKLEPRIKELVENYGHAIYLDRRYIDIKGRLMPKGLKIGLFIDNSVLMNKELVFKHSYEEEVSADPWPPKTIHPSVRLDGKYVSAYLKISHVDLYESYYDRTLSTLKEVMKLLGVEVDLVEPATSQDEDEEEGKDSSKIKKRKIIENAKIDSFEKMITLLKLLADELDCPGFRTVIERLERGEWIIPYFIYRFGSKKLFSHRRSSYSIVENHIMEALAYLGIRKDVFKQVFLQKLEDAQRKLCKKYKHGCTHKTESRDISTAFKLKAFGHDMADNCIYKILGLCPYENCPYTFHGKLFSASSNKLYLLVKQVEAM